MIAAEIAEDLRAALARVGGVISLRRGDGIFIEELEDAVGGRRR